MVCLTHWGRDEMDAIFQTTFSNGFSWMKMYEFRLTFQSWLLISKAIHYQIILLKISYDSQKFHWHVPKLKNKYVQDYAFEIIIWMSSYSREKWIKHKSIVNFSIYLHMRHPPQIINLFNHWTGITMITLFVHEAAGNENGTWVGVTKAPFTNFSVTGNFDLAKV